MTVRQREPVSRHFASAIAARLWSPRPVASAPKRFAQGIGLACTTTATVLIVLGQATAGWPVAGLVVVFASLEAGLGVCMGCWIYGRLQSAGLISPTVCVDCARLGQASQTAPSVGSVGRG